VKKEIKATHFRWTIVLLMFCSVIVNYLNRASISYTIEPIISEFNLNSTEIGLILGAFGLGYPITTLLGGIAVDRFGPRRILTISMLAWSLVMFTMSLSAGFLSLLISRYLLGLAEGPFFPSLTRVIGDWFPPEERTTALSYTFLGGPIALAIGAPLVSQLVIHYSWRNTIFLLGLSVLLVFPFFFFIFKDFPEKSPYVNFRELQIIRKGKIAEKFKAATIYQARRTSKGVWNDLLTNPTLLSNYWAFFVCGYYTFFFINWLPEYFTKTFHLSLTRVGLLIIIPWIFCIVTMLLFGHLSDLLFKKTRSYRYSRSLIISISQAISALSTFSLLLTQNPWIATVFLSLAIGCMISNWGLYYATNIDVLKEHAGTAFGIMNSLNSLSAFLAPSITGLTLTATTNFKISILILSVLAISSAIIVFFFHHFIRSNHSSTVADHSATKS